MLGRQNTPALRWPAFEAPRDAGWALQQNAPMTPSQPYMEPGHPPHELLPYAALDGRAAPGLERPLRTAVAVSCGHVAAPGAGLRQSLPSIAGPVGLRPTASVALAGATARP